MNHDVIEQFNQRAHELTPRNHQRALKMAVLKSLQAQRLNHQKRISVGLFFNVFSMSLTKKVVAGFGIAIFALAIIVGWNPVMQRLGFKNSGTTYVSAQEMLNQTIDNINSLPP